MAKPGFVTRRSSFDLRRFALGFVSTFVIFLILPTSVYDSEHSMTEAQAPISTLRAAGPLSEMENIADRTATVTTAKQHKKKDGSTVTVTKKVTHSPGETIIVRKKASAKLVARFKALRRLIEKTKKTIKRIERKERKLILKEREIGRLSLKEINHHKKMSRRIHRLRLILRRLKKQRKEIRKKLKIERNFYTHSVTHTKKKHVEITKHVSTPKPKKKTGFFGGLFGGGSGNGKQKPKPKKTKKADGKSSGFFGSLFGGGKPKKHVTHSKTITHKKVVKDGKVVHHKTILHHKKVINDGKVVKHKKLVHHKKVVKDGKVVKHKKIVHHKKVVKKANGTKVAKVTKHVITKKVVKKKPKKSGGLFGLFGGAGKETSGNKKGEKVVHKKIVHHKKVIKHVIKPNGSKVTTVKKHVTTKHVVNKPKKNGGLFGIFGGGHKKKSNDKKKSKSWNPTGSVGDLAYSSPRLPTSKSLNKVMKAGKNSCYCRMVKSKTPGRCYFFTSPNGPYCASRDCKPSYECVEAHKKGTMCVRRKVTEKVVSSGWNRCKVKKVHEFMYVPYS